MATLPAGLSADQVQTLSFITGLDAAGRLTAANGWSLGHADPAEYDGGATARKWAAGPAGSPGGTIPYRFDAASAWVPAERQAFRWAMALWSDVANVAFQEVAYGDAARLVFHRHTGPEQGGAYAAISAGAGTLGGTVLPAIHEALISIDTRQAGWTRLDSFTRYGAYGVMTVVHEIGHVLGLAHSGPYDGTVNPATQQLNATDTLLWSVMSYIAPTDAGARYFAASPVAGTNWGRSADGYRRVPTTPQMLDILAVQQLYGPAAGGALSGGQTYGFNCTIAGDSRPFYDFTVNPAPVVTLWNGGGGNTLDLSGYGMACTVDLNPGAFSSVAGMTNNLAIAYGTRIDTVIGGAGNDVFIPNTGDDAIDGGGGSNTLVLRGVRPDYVFARMADGALRVTPTVSGFGGSVTARNIQTLRFGDSTTLATAALTGGPPTPPPAPASTPTPAPSPTPSPAPPPAPGIAGLAPGEDTGASAADAVTSVTRPWLRGVAAPGGTVTLYRVDDAGGPVPVGTATAAADGTWSARPGAPLGDGAHVFVAVASGAGGAGPASAPFRLVIDTRPPAPPVLAGLHPGDAARGVIGGVVLAGWAEPGSTLALFDGGVPVAATAAGADGAWTVALPGLADGEHAFTAAATDPAGNVSAGSDTVPLAVFAPVFAPEAAPGRGGPVAVEATRRASTVLAGPDGAVLVRAPGGERLVRGAGEIRFLDGRLVFDPSDPAAQVARLYQAGLGRQADAEGLSHWTERLRGGDALSRLAGEFLDGPEFVARFGRDDSDAGVVGAIYRNVLGRAPDADGGAYWTGRLAEGAGRANVLAAISESDENKQVTGALLRGGVWDLDEDAARVARMYHAVLGRAPDAGGLGYWARGLGTGALALQDMADGFVGSPEFHQVYGALGARDFVEAIYGNTLRRPGDAEGIAYWTARLDAGLSRAGAVVAFSESQEHRLLTAPDVLGVPPDRLGVVTV